MFQIDLIEFDMISPLIEIVIIIFLIILMIYCYRHFDGFWIMTIILVFSVIFGIISLANFQLPFTPFIQTFFIVIQLLMVLFKIINLQ